MVPPVNAGTFLGTEGCVGLYTGTLHTRARHKAAIKQAGFVVVLGRYEGMALGKQATQGERGHTWSAPPGLFTCFPGLPSLLEPAQRHPPKRHDGYGNRRQKVLASRKGRTGACAIRRIETYSAHLNGPWLSGCPLSTILAENHLALTSNTSQGQGTSSCGCQI